MTGKKVVKYTAPQLAEMMKLFISQGNKKFTLKCFFFQKPCRVKKLWILFCYFRLHLGFNVLTISVMATLAWCVGTIFSGLFVSKIGPYRWIEHISTLLVTILTFAITALLWTKEMYFGENFALSVLVLVGKLFFYLTIRGN